MRRSLVRWKADPELIVQKRLPWQVRKQQLRRNLWKEEEEAPPETSQTSSIVMQIAQAARRRQRQPRLWANLLDQALARQGELTPQDMANVLWSMSEARYQHDTVLDEFVRSLSYRSNVKAMVTAMLAVDRLGLPTDMLRAPFLQQLSGQCDSLSFGDLRRVLMALARCWKVSPVEPDLLRELCDAITVKAADCDPRDLIAVPQHLGRLRHLHGGLLAAASDAVSAIISSRLAVIPLDVLRAYDGFLLLLPLVERQPAKDHLSVLAEKCRLLAAQLLRKATQEERWRTGAQLLGAEVTEPDVWSVWIHEVVHQRSEGVGRAQRVGQVRSLMARQWSLQRLPEWIELAIQRALQPQLA